MQMCPPTLRRAVVSGRGELHRDGHPLVSSLPPPPCGGAPSVVAHGTHWILQKATRDTVTLECKRLCGGCGGCGFVLCGLSGCVGLWVYGFGFLWLAATQGTRAHACDDTPNNELHEFVQRYTGDGKSDSTHLKQSNETFTLTCSRIAQPGL